MYPLNMINRGIFQCYVSLPEGMDHGSETLVVEIVKKTKRGILENEGQLLGQNADLMNASFGMVRAEHPNKPSQPPPDS